MIFKLICSWPVSISMLLILLARTDCWGPKPKSVTESPESSTIHTNYDVTNDITDDDDVITSATTETTSMESDGECQRDDRLVQTQDRACGERCVSDADCGDSERRCVCDPPCGRTCARTDRECPLLKAPAFGMMKVGGRKYADKTIYACRENYRLVGASSRVCQLNGAWSSGEPSCQPYNSSAYCYGAPVVSNARHNGSSDHTTFAVDSSLQYSCYAGYQRHGLFSEARCLAFNGTAKWFGPDIICKPRKCGNPPVVQNSAVKMACAQFLCNATYSCNKGFELVGRNDIFCQSDASWHPAGETRCQRVRCPLPTSPVNGRVASVSSEFGSLARYACQSGFMLVGDKTRECLSDSTWSGVQPVCEAPSEIDCGPAGPLYNGWIGGNSTAMGAQITYNCDDNTVRVGQSQTATCSGNGRWSHPTPKCMGACAIPSISRGIIVNSSLAQPSTVSTPSPPRLVLHGEKIEVQCDKGFEMHLSHEMPQCYNGTWTHMPICAPGHCKALPQVSDNAYVVAPKNTHGSRARYACIDGYVLRGAKFTTCKYGEWIGKPAKCEIVYCKFPGTLANGSVLLVGNMGLYDYRAYVRKVRNNRMITYKCRRGYTLIAGPPGATCVNGQWRPSRLPRCTPDQHPMLTTWLAGRARRDVRDREHQVVMTTRHNNNQQPSYTSNDSNVVAAFPRSQNWATDFVVLNGSNAEWPSSEQAFNTSVDPNTAVTGQNHSAPLSHVNEVEQEYMLGSDILHSQEDVSEAGMCGDPSYINTSLSFQYTGVENESNNHYLEGTEITFECVAGMNEQKTSWKIVCENGVWTGHPFSCEEEMEDEEMDNESSSGDSRSCEIDTRLEHVMTFYNDQPVLEAVVNFPSGTRLMFRCEDIGKYTMVGSRVRVCQRGEWTGLPPACYGLNQMNDYALEKPPTILFRHNGGAIAQTNDGKLVVYPGTILHLECLWIRKFGTPSWEVSHQLRSYSQGWTTEEGRDSNLEYRLSIMHAQISDSGTYTCVTPQRHRHAVQIDVRAVHCSAVVERPGLHKNTHSTQINTLVEFSCSNSNSLIGAHQITCLASANWSAPAPHCQTIECPDFVADDIHLKVAILSRHVSGRAMFDCPRGYERVGASEAYCQFDGQWSSPPASCRELLCETPVAPEHGYATPLKQNYLVGDVVQISCDHGFMMTGTPIIKCLANKQWSDEMPTCEEACTYPGSTIGSVTSSVRFYYGVGEQLMFSCVDPLQLVGHSQLQCLEGGSWSHQPPTCVPGN